MLGIGKMVKNLYVIESVVENHFCNFFKPQDMTVDKWHAFFRTSLLNYNEAHDLAEWTVYT